MAVVSEEDLGEEESQWGSVNLVQELGGINLWQYIEKHGRAELDWALFLAMAKDIYNAVEFLATNLIVHHDIKPHNLLVRPRGGWVGWWWRVGGWWGCTSMPAVPSSRRL